MSNVNDWGLRPKRQWRGRPQEPSQAGKWRAYEATKQAAMKKYGITPAEVVPVKERQAGGWL